MSILIKGMEMQKDGCRDCIFVNRKWHGDICQILKIEVTGNVERGGFQTDCPLIEIKPHGDLIDRDAMITSMKISGSPESIAECVDRIVRFMDTLNDAPVVIEAER